MSTTNHAVQVAASLLEQVAVSLQETAAKLKALENRLGMTHTREISSPVSPGDIDISDPPPEKERDPWVWVSGETMPYRQLFRDAGGRWSRKRQAWYWMNATELPSHLRDLTGIEVSVSR